MAEPLAARCAAWADRHGMLPARGEALLCAVSGGADSVCLLLLMLELSRTRGFAVACAHFDHRLRGAESTRDADFTAALCDRLGVPFHSGSGDVRAFAAEHGLGLEDAARRRRYAFLEETADALGANRIATAHNADDNAETMLLHLARGAGTRGLAGIPPVRGKIVRPLLFAARAEIEDFLRARGEGWVTDSSNLTDDYARNRLRHDAMPVLREINGGFARHALQTAALLRADEQYFVDLAAHFIAAHGARGAGALTLPAGELAALPAPVRARVLRLACGAPLSPGQLEALYRLCAPGRSGAAADVPGMRVTRSFDRLVFGAQDAPAMPERVLAPDSTLFLPEAGLSIRRTDREISEIHSSFNIFFFKKTDICGRILVRSKKSGDSLRPMGRGCTKSLKKLLLEARVPAARRACVPVLADEKGVLAVVGFGADARRAAPPGVEAVKIEVTER